MRDDALLALRLWRDADRGTPWRAQVTDLRDGSVATFVDVPALLRYISDAFGAETGFVAGVEERPPSTAETDGGGVGDA